MKGTIAVLLAIILMLSALPMTVFAADEEELSDTGANYNLWLGSTQVTDANKDNIFGDGRARYNPSSNSLYLWNAVIPDAYYTANGKTAKIYASSMRLSVYGSYTTPSTECDYGIYISSGELTLKGIFRFLGKHTAIHCEGN